MYTYCPSTKPASPVAITSLCILHHVVHAQGLDLWTVLVSETVKVYCEIFLVCGH